jgi:WD40 repeat protein
MTAFTRDGKRLLGNVGNRLLCWDLASGKELHDRPGDIDWSRVVTISPDGRRVAATSARGCAVVSVWDSASGRRLHDLPADEAVLYVSHLAFCADGRTLTAVHDAGSLKTWDITSGQELGQVTLRGAGRGRLVANFQTFHLSPEGETASTVELLDEPAKAPKRASLWRLPAGVAMAEYALPADTSGYAWLRDGKALAYSHPGGVTLVDLASGDERLRAAAPTLGALTASPDERLLAAVQSGGKVAVWETATGRPVTVVEPSVEVLGLALLPGNRLLLTMDRRRLHVWDMATGKERQGWDLPEGTMAADDRCLLAFPGGRRALTVLGDGTVLIWGLTLAVVAPAALPPGAKELEAKWADLAADDARKAYAAVWRFGEASEREAVAFLRWRLRPAAVADAKAVGKHVEDLGSAEFPVRAKAEQALEAMGRAAVPAMWTALAKGPSLEVRLRLKKLLAKAEREPASPEVLRGLRALQALEGFASLEVQGLLEELAKGNPHEQLRVAAAAALERVKRRALSP